MSFLVLNLSGAPRHSYNQKIFLFTKFYYALYFVYFFQFMLICLTMFVYTGQLCLKL